MLLFVKYEQSDQASQTIYNIFGGFIKDGEWYQTRLYPTITGTVILIQLDVHLANVLYKMLAPSDLLNGRIEVFGRPTIHDPDVSVDELSSYREMYCRLAQIGGGLTEVQRNRKNLLYNTSLSIIRSLSIAHRRPAHHLSQFGTLIPPPFHIHPRQHKPRQHDQDREK